MKRTPVLHILITLLLLASCSDSSKMEKENNDSFDSANVIKTGRSVEGYLQDEKDKDFFRLSLDRPVTLTFHLSSVKGINHALSVYNSRKDLLKRVDDSRKSSPEELANLSLDPGDYFLVVDHGDRDRRNSNDENSYTLTVEQCSEIVSEREPNDGPEKAAPLGPEKPVRGFFSPAFNRENRSKENPMREEDWFYLDAEGGPGGPMLLDAKLSGVPGINSLIELYNEKYELLARTDNHPSGSGERLEGFGVPERGRLYIVVASGTYLANVRDTYTISVQLRSHEEGQEIERNDSRGEATLMKGREMRGTLGGATDLDYFRLESLEEGVYMVRLEGGAMDLSFAIYDPEGNRLWDIDNSGDGDEILPNVRLHNGMFILVKGSAMKETAHYRLTLAPLEKNRALEQEPNDTRSTASRPHKNRMIGFQTTGGDRDYFEISTKSRKDLLCTARGIDNVRMKVSITDHMGYIIKAIEVPGRKETTFQEMIDGKGFLIVEFSGDNYRDPYLIHCEVEK